MKPRIPFGTAVLLGCVGLVLPYFHPLLYSAAAGFNRTVLSGQPAPELYLVALGLLMAPLGWGLFCLCLYRETSQTATAWVRRIASGVATILIALAAASLAWQESILRNATGLDQNPPLLRVAFVMNMIVYAGWLLLCANFALGPAPLRGSLTSALALFVAMATVALEVLGVYGIWRRRSYLGARHMFAASYLLADAIEVACWVLVLVFLVAVRNECARQRRTPMR
jgi:hypothetical protein